MFDGLARWSGTSFSAPLVTGLIAARMAAHPEESAEVAAGAVLAAAEDVAGVGPVLSFVTKIGKAADDRGTALTAQPASARSQPTGAMHSATVRLTGVTREAKRIAVLQGQFTVTASDKLLAFTFDDLTKGKTAVTLPADRATAVQQSLARMTGRTVTLATRVDPSIIGGVVARIGSTIYDGSVATQLQKMKQRLVESV